jgi:glutamate racemase
MKSPIGLFDSGFGGLTVMREVIRLLPHESLIYLGDTARLPYGNKSPETVLQYAVENSRFLLQKGIKLLIIPCHTACSHALQHLREILPIPVIGVTEAGVDLLKNYSRIAILATQSTIESEVYQNKIRESLPHAKLFAKACPLFVPLVEEGFYNHVSAELIAENYLSSLKGKIDAALLACTHYPLIRSPIQKVLGPEVELIEPASACALKAQEILTQLNLLNHDKTPSYEYYVSDAPEKFRTLGEIFLGKKIEKVEKKHNF